MKNLIMNSITIPLNGKPVSETANAPVVIIIGWDALIPTISKEVRLRPDETIDAVCVSDQGDIEVRIFRKKGRKARAETAKSEPGEVEPTIELMDIEMEEK